MTQVSTYPLSLSLSLSLSPFPNHISLLSRRALSPLPILLTSDLFFPLKSLVFLLFSSFLFFSFPFFSFILYFESRVFMMVSFPLSKRQKVLPFFFLFFFLFHRSSCCFSFQHLLFVQYVVIIVFFICFSYWTE